MKKTSLLLIATALLLPISAQAQSVVSSTKQTAPAQQSKGIWIDVRSPEEFQQGHLNGAINITPQQIAQRIVQISPDKNAPIHLYCRSGRRAEVALQTLKQMGYRNVSNHGGYDDLVKKGFK